MQRATCNVNVLLVSPIFSSTQEMSLHELPDQEQPGSFIGKRADHVQQYLHLVSTCNRLHSLIFSRVQRVLEGNDFLIYK